MKSEKINARKAFGKWSFGMFIGYLAFIFSLFTFHFSLFTTASAQDDQTEIAPPPLKLVAKSELTRLDAQSDAKARTKLALELMSERLTAAEKLNAAQDFTGVFRELGDFQGLMDNSLDYLTRRDNGSNKVLDNFKRLEIGLRSFGPRLDGIYRDLPRRFEEYIRKLMKYVRDARTKATDPLFGDTVVPRAKTDQ